MEKAVKDLVVLVAEEELVVEKRNYLNIERGLLVERELLVKRYDRSF